MKVDVSKIDGFDGMSDQEKIAALLGLEIDDNSAEITRLKNQLSKANSEAKSWKDKHDATLSEDQKKAAERDAEFEAIKKERDTLKKEKELAEYKSSFLAQGYSDDLAAKAAEALSSGDTAALFKCQSDFISAHDKSREAELLKKTPAPPSGSAEKPDATNSKELQALLDRGDLVGAAAYIRTSQNNEN